MDYENETCEVCVWWCNNAGPDGDLQKCMNLLGRSPDHGVGEETCDHFAPSLECRKVRALEKLAEQMAWLAYVSAGGRNPPVDS